MLEPDDYLVVSAVSNGYLVSVNNDVTEDETREVHVFNDVSELLIHVGSLLGHEVKPKRRASAKALNSNEIN